MARTVDLLLGIELPPGEPTAEEVKAMFGAEIADVLQDAEDTDDGYNTLTSKVKMLSVEKKIQILELPLDPQSGTHGKMFVHILRAQVALCQGTENNVVRADEGNFRAKVADILLPELLQRVLAERQRLSELPFRRTLD